MDLFTLRRALARGSVLGAIALGAGASAASAAPADFTAINPVTPLTAASFDAPGAVDKPWVRINMPATADPRALQDQLPSRCAAAVKLPVSATATKYSSCLSSIRSRYAQCAAAARSRCRPRLGVGSSRAREHGSTARRTPNGARRRSEDRRSRRTHAGSRRGGGRGRGAARHPAGRRRRDGRLLLDRRRGLRHARHRRRDGRARTAQRDTHGAWLREKQRWSSLASARDRRLSRSSQRRPRPGRARDRGHAPVRA